MENEISKRNINVWELYLCCCGKPVEWNGWLTGKLKVEGWVEKVTNHPLRRSGLVANVFAPLF